MIKLDLLDELSVTFVSGHCLTESGQHLAPGWSDRRRAGSDKHCAGTRSRAGRHSLHHSKPVRSAGRVGPRHPVLRGHPRTAGVCYKQSLLEKALLYKYTVQGLKEYCVSMKHPWQINFNKKLNVIIFKRNICLNAILQSVNMECRV